MTGKERTGKKKGGESVTINAGGFYYGKGDAERNDWQKRRIKMFDFFAGLGTGFVILVVYAILVAGGKADLEKENARLRKELRILKGG